MMSGNKKPSSASAVLKEMLFAEVGDEKEKKLTLNSVACKLSYGMVSDFLRSCKTMREQISPELVSVSLYLFAFECSLVLPDPDINSQP